MRRRRLGPACQILNRRREQCVPDESSGTYARPKNTSGTLTSSWGRCKALRTSLLADDDFDAAIFLPSLGSVITRDRSAIGMPLRVNFIRRHAALGQGLARAFGTCL